jgi:DHA2 family multidrug resistance protein-like MFS transporter
MLTRIHASRTRQLLALVALALPTLLVAVDISVIGVALPSIARNLDASASQLLWISDSYNYLVAGTMLTMGALADRLGRRRVIIVCSAVFALASAAGAFAPTATALILARAVMGVAGAAIMPASISLLGVVFTNPKARVQAMGASMTVLLAGMTAAPFLGGLLLARFWWGSVFLIGVPVMLVAVLAVTMLVPESRADTAPRIDLTSTALSVLAVIALVYALKSALNDGAGPAAIVALVVGIVAAVAFLRRQRRLPQPLLDLRVLRDRGVGPALAAMLLTAVLMGGSSLFFNLYLQEVQGLTPLRAAAWMAPQMAAMILASNAGPWLGRRFQHGTVVFAMLSVMAAGFVVYVLVPTGAAGRPLAALGGALATFGVGAAYPLLMDRVIGAAAPERAGATAALAQLSNELGIALGLTVLGSLGTLAYRARLALPGSPANVSVVNGVHHAAVTGNAAELATVRAAFTHAFNIVGVIAVLVMLGVLYLVRRRRNTVGAVPTKSAVAPSDNPETANDMRDSPAA